MGQIQCVFLKEGTRFLLVSRSKLKEKVPLANLNKAAGQRQRIQREGCRQNKPLLAEKGGFSTLTAPPPAVCSECPHRPAQ